MLDFLFLCLSVNHFLFHRFIYDTLDRSDGRGNGVSTRTTLLILHMILGRTHQVHLCKEKMTKHKKRKTRTNKFSNIHFRAVGSRCNLDREQALELEKLRSQEFLVEA